jgi:hypothetical protein
MQTASVTAKPTHPLTASDNIMLSYSITSPTLLCCQQDASKSLDATRRSCLVAVLRKTTSLSLLHPYYSLSFFHTSLPSDSSKHLGLLHQRCQVFCVDISLIPSLLSIVNHSLHPTPISVWAFPLSIYIFMIVIKGKAMFRLR